MAERAQEHVFQALRSGSQVPQLHAALAGGDEQKLGALPGGQEHAVAVLRLAPVTALIAQVGQEGYGLSFYAYVEDVALRSGVNKTTIYRRWPTKPELVGAALRAVWEPPDVPDTGSVRGDFLASLAKTAAFAMSPIGKGLTHVIQLERAHPEVEPIARGLREEYRKLREQLVERAVLDLDRAVRDAR